MVNNDNENKASSSKRRVVLWENNHRRMKLLAQKEKVIFSRLCNIAIHEYLDKHLLEHEKKERHINKMSHKDILRTVTFSEKEIEDLKDIGIVPDKDNP